MKKLIYYFSLFPFTFSLFWGCSPQQKLQHLENKHPELFKPIVKDSTSTSVQYITHDSLINIPGQTIMLRDTFLVNKPCPTHFSKTIKTGGETAILKIDSGKVTVICKDDSLKQEILLRDKIISKFKEHVQVGIAENDVYKTHWYDYFCRTFVGITLVFLLVWVALKAIKPSIP
jgi:hypothetical protein